jgi:flavodoxin
MKILIVYDSVFGNTQKIAETIGAALAGHQVKVVNVQEFTVADLTGIELLIAGCPTQSWTSTVAMNGFIHEIPDEALNGIKTATFDTRVRSRFAGSAAPKIEKGLKKKGALIIAPPMAFLVKGRQGPLMAGEEQRASEWAKQLLTK